MPEPLEPSQTIDSKILRRIRGRGRGSVFTPADFLHLGSRAAVDLALHRFVRKGTVRRLARGLYDYPRTHPELGTLAPPLDAIARALAGRHKVRLQPSPAAAANLLQLTEQVPARAVFLTDGPSRKVKIGPREIVLRRTTPRNMATAGRTSGLVLQALHHLGEENVSAQVVAHLRGLLSEKDRRQLLDDLPLAPAWMHATLRTIAAEGVAP